MNGQSGSKRKHETINLYNLSSWQKVVIGTVLLIFLVLFLIIFMTLISIVHGIYINPNSVSESVHEILSDRIPTLQKHHEKLKDKGPKLMGAMADLYNEKVNLQSKWPPKKRPKDEYRSFSDFAGNNNNNNNEFIFHEIAFANSTKMAQQRLNTSSSNIQFKIMTYGQNCCINAKKRFCENAMKYKEFNECLALSQKNISQSFLISNKRVFDVKRGAGLWCWKPYLINKILASDRLDYGDYLVYMDAGMKQTNDNNKNNNKNIKQWITNTKWNALSRVL